MKTNAMVGFLLALSVSAGARAEVGPVWHQFEIDAIKAAGHPLKEEELRANQLRTQLVQWLCASVKAHLSGKINRGLAHFPHLKLVANVTCKLRLPARPPPRKETFMQRLKGRAMRTFHLVATKWQNAWSDVKNNFSCGTLLKYMPTPMTMLADVLGGFFDANPNGPGLRQCLLEFQSGLVCSIPDLVVDSVKMLHAVFWSEKSRPIRETCRRFINPGRRFAEWVAGKQFREGSPQDLLLRVPEAPMAPMFAACAVGTWAVKKTVQVVKCLTSGNLGRIIWQELFKLGCSIAGGLVVDILITVLSGGSGAVAAIAKGLQKVLTILGRGAPTSLARIGKAVKDAQTIAGKIASSSKDALKNAAILGAMNTLRSTAACKAAFDP